MPRQLRDAPCAVCWILRQPARSVAVALHDQERDPRVPRDRAGARLYVADGNSDDVAVIDTASLAVVTTIADIGTRPWGIGISPDGRKLYTANGPSGDVSIVDVASGKVDARVAVGGSPWGIAVAAPK